MSSRRWLTLAGLGILIELANIIVTFMSVPPKQWPANFHAWLGTMWVGLPYFVIALLFLYVGYKWGTKTQRDQRSLASDTSTGPRVLSPDGFKRSFKEVIDTNKYNEVLIFG